MINEVRNTVLFLLNKENRGYITPSEFDSMADLAQMSIFEKDFYDYSRAIVKSNARLYNTEFSDIPKNLRERIDYLSKEGDLVLNSDYWNINSNDFYRLLNIYTQSGNDVEEVLKTDINRLLQSNVTRPTNEYPVFVKYQDGYKIYPDTIENLKCVYISRPKRPKWTYNLINRNPVFNPSALDYQDFQLHPSCESELIVKILGYCGLSIREADVIQASQLMQGQETQVEQ